MHSWLDRGIPMCGSHADSTCLCSCLEGFYLCVQPQLHEAADEIPIDMSGV